MILKFRAWNGKEMIDPNLVVVYLTAGFVEKPSFDLNRINLEDGEVELMQFTGLTDKNANDIYVDDIVQDKEKSYMRVIWDDRRLCYTIEGENLGDYDSCDLEIIGNIHQHSHLLDKGE